MVLVSHDFRLIDQVAKEIWVCEKQVSNVANPLHDTASCHGCLVLCDNRLGSAVTTALSTCSCVDMDTVSPHVCDCW